MPILSGFPAGGVGLNFIVVGNPQPENPKENTIWVDTDTSITGYSFSGSPPENPVAGHVWITTGSPSAMEFNALEKNVIQVYPLTAKQYVSGTWVEVDIKNYKNGEWVGLIRYILQGNNLFEGWAPGGTTQSITQESNGLRVTRNGAHSPCNSNVAYDISNYSAVYLEYAELTAPIGIEVFVNTVKHVSGVTTPLATAQSKLGSASANGTVIVDLSKVKNIGNMYIAFALFNNQTGSCLVKSIYFK